MAGGSKIRFVVVPASTPNQFTVQYTVSIDENDIMDVDITTDAPLSEMPGPVALAEVVVFTENILKVIQEGREALMDGSAYNVSDSFNTKKKD